MKRRAMLRLLVLLVSLTVLAMALPLAIALALKENAMVKAFGITMGAVFAAAVPVLAATRKQPLRFTASDGFLLVFLTWVAACFLGALPYYLSRHILRMADAVYESVSGFTTTGSSIITDLELMPRSLIFWRAETHWLGGMGMVVLTVALLPLLGVGGFQLVKAETTGPDKDRITPKITETAKLLWLMYIILTAVEALLLRLAGMSLFDAVIHAFSTIATGGFSSRNESIAYYQSPLIEWIITVFMIIAGCNFSLLYRLFRRKFREVYYNSEARAYALIIVIAAAIIALSTATAGNGGTDPPASALPAAIRHGFFYTASVLTTTGFSVASHNLWPALAQGVLFVLLFIGGCSGSTAGGIKVVRHVVLVKQMQNEMRKVIYPRGVFSIRLNNKVGRRDVVYGVSGFVALYFIITGLCSLVLAGAGLDFYSALNASASSIGNVGLGLGHLESAAVFHAFPAYIKWILSFVMIAGRLELWTALVFLSKAYWR
ncbi:MAG: TrkH family potassium uptake protein [Spirochaetaceae bacterium]|jgi:trk system potassium uptake protein TrkH|nr:TrkH family potassium uptake protein [Spirochaetaceae bacterium]